MKLYSTDFTMKKNTKESFSNEILSNRYCHDIKDPQCYMTKLLAKELIDYLRYFAGRAECSFSVDNQIKDNNLEFNNKCVHINKVIDYLVRDRSLIVPIELQDKAIESVLKAIIKNIHWDILLLNSSYSQTHDIEKAFFFLYRRCDNISYGIYRKVIMEKNTLQIIRVILNFKSLTDFLHALTKEKIKSIT